MSSLETSPPRTRSRPITPRRTVLRWMVTFTGFPLGGLAAITLTGPVDTVGAALTGGLLTGAVLGGVQAWGLGPARVRPAAWVAATAIGMMVGLTLGSATVDYRTGLGSLVVQGAVTGLFVGAAQAMVLRPRIGAAAVVWPVFLGGVWATGWAITTLGGIHVEDQFTVFGSFGAITAALLTAVLPTYLDLRGSVTEES